MGKVDKLVITALQNSDKPLSLLEIADQIEKSQKTVFKSLRRLFEKEEINVDPKTRRYFLAKKSQ